MYNLSVQHCELKRYWYWHSEMPSCMYNKGKLTFPQRRKFFGDTFVVWPQAQVRQVITADPGWSQLTPGNPRWSQLTLGNHGWSQVTTDMLIFRISTLQVWYYFYTPVLYCSTIGRSYWKINTLLARWAHADLYIPVRGASIEFGIPSSFSLSNELSNFK